MVGRGTVSSIKSRKAVIAASGGIITPPLSVPERFLDVDDSKKLKPGQTVVFAYFEDGTGTVLERI